MATGNKVVYDPDLIPRVKQYLEANVHKTYVDIEEMTNSLMNRYSEYSRRKRIPFRVLVEQAYKLVLRDYGLDSSNGSDVEGSDDLEVMDELAEGGGGNQMNNVLNSLYMKKPNPVTSTSDAASKVCIDISSDEEDDNKEGESSASTVQSKTLSAKPPTSSIPAEEFSTQSTSTKVTNGTKSFDSLISNIGEVTIRPGPASQKKRKLESTPTHETSNSTVPEFPASSKSQQPQSKPKKFKKEVYATRSNVTFADVGGADKILKELCELILHIKHPEMYKHIGLPPPRGILLSGPPGSGKTLLANAIAGQLDVLLVEVPATELIAGVSGESEERIREIFEQAAVFAPCVLFIDEIDAISSNRQNAQKDMERRIVSQLLSSLDGMSKLKYGDEVLVIGATNRPDVLDPALRRVGRFDHEISLGIPDRSARSQILNIITRDLKINDSFDYDEIASLTPGYVAADLLALTTRAALTAIKRVIRSKEIKAVTANVKENEEITKVSENEDVNMPPPQEADVETKESDKDDVVKMDIDETQKIPEELIETVPNTESNEISTENVEAIKENETENVKSEMETDHTESPNDEQKITENPIEEKIEKKTLPIIPPLNELKLEEMLKWLQTDAKLIEIEELREMSITRDDFIDAVKHTQPSSKREGFVTVPDVTWDDIGSLQDIRSELKLAILAPVKFPEKLERLGLQSPSGIMLCGPPGCGKTLLAKAIANEAGINFISVKGPELLNMYVGESERAVRQCFQRAKNSAPCVIFFDEFDSLCPKRSDSGENSSQRVVNQLLTEMDGIEDRKGVFLMAATNRPDIIDPAVLRPGRLDKILYVGLPNITDRVEIFRALTKNGQKPELADDVNFEEIAALTDGYTGADLAGLVRQAALQTLKESIEGDQESDDLKVHRNHFIEVIRKVKPSVNSEDIKHYDLLKIKYGARQEN